MRRHAECTRDSGFWGLAASMECSDTALYATSFLRIEILVGVGKKFFDPLSVSMVDRNADAGGKPRLFLVLGHHHANAIRDVLRFFVLRLGQN
jgi:hypothetical protein